MDILHDINLENHTTFHIPAKASTVITYNREDLWGLIEEIRKVKNDKRILHIGSGSNLLFLGDFDGIILKSDIHELTWKEEGDDILCGVGAAWVMDDFINEAISRSWYGLENLSLIPGEVGASAVQNIGAYGVEAADLIEEVETIELATGNIRIWKKEECDYGYRHSIFKEKDHWGRYAVLTVTYRLHNTFTPILDYGGLSSQFATSPTAQQLRETIIKIRREKLPDPAIEGNAGSFFMNPVVEKEKFQQLLALYPQMPHYKVDEEHEKIPAGWMIDQCGWKGKTLGAAGVHDKQALVLVNKGGATGNDIVRLSDAIRKDVLDKFGIDIHPEVNFI